MPLGLLGDAEEEGAAPLVEGGAARVFHPNGTVLPPVDTTDGAPLYPFGVGYVDDRPDDRIPGTIVLLLGTLGGVGLGGGGGFALAVLGGLVGLGAGTAFVGRAVVVVVGGGLGLLGRGIAPSSLSSDDLKENFRFLVAGWGGLGFAWGGGGFGAVVVDAPPPRPPPRSPRPLPCSPTSPHPPPPPPHTPPPAS